MKRPERPVTSIKNREQIKTLINEERPLTAVSNSRKGRDKLLTESL